MGKVKLTECFETYQGEGPDSGRKMLITRFRECDRVVNGNACSWCDTLIKMRISCEAEYGIDEIMGRTARLGGLMITGGEPTYDKNLDSTLSLLAACDFEVCNIETNGYNIKELINRMTKALDSSKYRRVKIVYSPKFFNIRECEQELEKIKEAIGYGIVYLKFVNDGSGLLEDLLYDVRSMNPRKDQVWIMPQGTSAQELIHNSPGTMDIVEKYDANFSSRNHIIFGFV